MRIPPGIRRALRLPATSERIRRELDDEIRLHVDLRIDTLVRRGLTREQAEAEAMRRFGDMDDLRDYCTTIEVSHMQRVLFRERVDGLLQDLRFALRQVRKSPGFAGVAALTLALGIGATTAIFSVVSQVVLKPLPYPHAERVVQIWEVASKTGNRIQLADPNFVDLEKYNKSFSAVAAYQGGTMALASNGEAIRAPIAAVTPRFFDVLGARPAAGRFFLPDEENDGTGGSLPDAPSVAVISYGFWQRQYAGARTAVGATITADSRSVTIVGILPRNLEFPGGTDVFVPVGNLRGKSRTSHNWRTFARIKEGVSVGQAQQDVSTLFRRLKAEYAGYMDATDAQVVVLQDQIAGPIKPTLYLLLGASGILLLIACANVVNLLVARMAARENELAVRVAIGAGRSRLIQQLLIEASVLALSGCVGGVLLAAAGVKALVVLRPANIPTVDQVSIDWRVLVFALLVSALTALGLGVIAAWRGASGDMRAALSHGQRTQGGGGATSRIRDGLVIVQVAMTVVLLVSAGLLGRSFVALMSVDPGWRTHDIVVATIAFPASSAPAEQARRVQYYDEAIAAARSMPGVTAAGGTAVMPLGSGNAGDGTFLILAGIDEKIQMSDFERLYQDKSRTGYADYRVVSADYFEAMNIPLVSGRFFSDSDRPDAPHVGLISASLAKKRWPSESPIGKAVQYGNMDGNLTPITIVGVVGDVREQSLGSNPERTFYVNYRQRPGYASTFNVVMTTTAAASVMNQMREALRKLRTDLPARVTTVEDLIGRSLTQQRFMLLLVGVFGVVALLLAALGVYSVISYLVAQRSHELSIRVALGARSADIEGLVLKQGVGLAMAGTAIGAAGALAVTRLLKRALYQISPTDPVAFLGVVVLLGVVAIVASYVPARRASRVSAMGVLRGG